MSQSLLAKETAEIPDVVSRQLSEEGDVYWCLGQELAQRAPQFLVTNARGSSDCAALYGKYLFESQIGLPVASMGPSLGSLYGSDLRLSSSVCLSLSQSGASPDLIALQRKAKQGGAFTIALVNRSDSGLGYEAERDLPLLAGPEQAVAASKSFVATLVAVAALYCGFVRDHELLQCLYQLPDALKRPSPWLQDDELFGALAPSQAFYTLGRGVGLSVASEAALKFKETCLLPAEAFSAAEVLHGPMALASPNLSVLVFAAEDEGEGSVQTAVQAFKAQGSQVFSVSANSSDGALQCAASPHPLLTPIVQITQFYRFVEAFSRFLGCDPDNPPHLSKITQTL